MRRQTTCVFIVTEIVAHSVGWSIKNCIFSCQKNGMERKREKGEYSRERTLALSFSPPSSNREAELDKIPATPVPALISASTSTSTSNAISSYDTNDRIQVRKTTVSKLLAFKIGEKVQEHQPSVGSQLLFVLLS